MKLRKLHIYDYKMFKNFDISFVDKNDEALPIVVLAGVNGSGKTSLLEFISECAFENDLEKNFIEVDMVNIYQDIKLTREVSSNKDLISIEENGINADILYLQTYTDLSDIKIFLPKYIESMVYDKGIAPFDAYKELKEYINIIFQDLDTQIEFDSRDGEGNLFFRNKSGGDKFSIDKLSTGEKTLLSKVLYFYLEKIYFHIILIDEPELSLHPSWQNKVLKIYENFAKQNNCQIIIATHSPHIISSAKNEYLRFLIKNEEGKIEAIENITAYGRDIEWVLEQMGVTDIRLPKITKRFNEIQELINNQEFDKAESALDKLEYVIGENDKDILALRNDLAFERIDFEEDN